MAILNMAMKMTACFFIVSLIIKLYMIIANKVGEELGFSRLYEKLCEVFFKKKRA